VTEHGENDELEEFGHGAVFRTEPLFAWGMDDEANQDKLTIPNSVNAA